MLAVCYNDCAVVLTLLLKGKDHHLDSNIQDSILPFSSPGSQFCRPYGRTWPQEAGSFEFSVTPMPLTNASLITSVSKSSELPALYCQLAGV